MSYVTMKNEHPIQKELKQVVPTKELQRAIKNVRVFDDTRVIKLSEKPSNVPMLIRKGDCLRSLGIDKKMCLLDFASDSNPGGGWRSKQQGTQEEHLCRNSSLGITLESCNKYPINTYGALFVETCYVLAPKTKQKLSCTVIVAALRQGDKNYIEQKTEGILKVAVANGVQNLIVGAWGCGAFGNEVDDVVSGWNKAISKFGGYFDQIVFAIR